MSSKKSNRSVRSSEKNEPVIGIICALKIEIAPLLDQLSHVRKQSGNDLNFYHGYLGDDPVCIAIGGVGKKLARSATHAIIDAFNPPYLISAGFSGGLTSDLKKHDVVVGSSVTQLATGDNLSLQPNMHSDPERRMHVGGLVMTDHIVRMVDEKQQIAKQTGAIAVDMESYSVARVCQDRMVPLMAIRVISDDLAEDLPQEIITILGSKGATRAGAIFKSLLKRPSSAMDLWNMRENAMTAADCLAKFLSGVIPQLAAAQANVNETGAVREI